MIKDRRMRREIVTQSHYWFFHFYFSEYVEYETAPFHKDLFALTEDESIPLVAITAFRNSGKSTIFNTSYPLWSIVGKQQKKFVLIIGRTQQRARDHLSNIKREAEKNALLKNDLGPLQEIGGDGPWNAGSLYLEKYDATIMAFSCDMSVRGVRQGPHRPDLIICDDVEDGNSAETLEGRDKTYRWIKGELVPAGSSGTRMIFIGNLVHEDCLLRRLRQEINDGKLNGVYREYPLLESDGTPLWPGRYPDAASVETERMRIGDDAFWQREYLLRILPNANRVVQRDWICYYDELPKYRRISMAATGVDLAISQKESADYTAMVSAKIFYDNDHIYVLPNPVNERLSSAATIARIEKQTELIGEGSEALIFVEDVGYQRSVVETLINRRFRAEGVSPMGQDKRARLALVAHAIEDGTILFPKTGCETLIAQLVGFGSERHDDLADAFSILMLKMTDKVARRKRGSAVGIGMTLDDGNTITSNATEFQQYRDDALEEQRKIIKYRKDFFRMHGRFPFSG